MPETTPPLKDILKADAPAAHIPRSKTDEKAAKEIPEVPELTPELQECCDKATD